jgi:hypothetical protein
MINALNIVLEVLMSDNDDAPEGHGAKTGPLAWLPWDVFTQGLPSDPRGKYYRLLADPRPEEIAAVAGAIQALEEELLRLAEIAGERHTAEVEQVQQPQTEATFGPPREAARLARLQAAQAALALASALLMVDSPDAAQEAARQAEASAERIAAWKRSGRGWFESRYINKGFEPVKIRNHLTGEDEWWWMPISFGPYRYFRWRTPDPETGQLKMQTWYLGKQEPADRNDPMTPHEAGDERPLDQPRTRGKARLPKRPPRRDGEAPRGGRPAKLTPEEVANLEAWLAEHSEEEG